MKYLKSFLLATLLIVCFASISMAMPIINIAFDGIEDMTDGSVYSNYQNSGDFLYIQSGNNNDILAVQGILSAYMGYVVTLSEGSVAYTAETDLASGTWATVPSSNTIDFYVVKASRAYAMYAVSPAESTGSWSTFDLWNAGYGGNDPLEISHYTGYVSSAVPAPTTILLLGSGLWGVLAYGRKRMKA